MRLDSWRFGRNHEGVDSRGESEILREVAKGRVRTVFSSAVSVTRADLISAALASDPTPTVISIQFPEAPAPDERRQSMMLAVADAARAVWPSWYATVAERFDRERWPMADVECRLSEFALRNPTLSAHWFRAAWSSCQRGDLPLIRGIQPTVQLAQLFLAIDPSSPVVVIAVAGAKAGAARIHSLGLSAEWLAAQTAARVLLIVPAAWRDVRELDVVAYGAHDHSPTDSAVPALGQPRTTEGNPADGSLCETDWAAETPVVDVEPHIGNPNPRSDAEQRLASKIRADIELAPLFRFNQRALGLGEVPYFVDLAWSSGKVIVEVDGPDHRSADKYRMDRERDYRLLSNGFLVLRVTNDDVMEDVMLVLEKIRNVVRLRSMQEGGR